MFNAKRTGLLIVSIISFVLAFIFLGYIAQMLFSYIKTGYAIIGLVLISPIGLAYMALGVFFTVLAVV
jgi:hypothetical protein